MPRVKIGIPLLVSAGIGYVRELLRGLDLSEVIFDLKLADIDSTMAKTVGSVSQVADSVIAHAFVGYRGALDAVREVCDKDGLGLYLVGVMSHPGWPWDLSQVEQVIREVNPEGLVMPATKPETVRQARLLFPEKVIISPGIGQQGGSPGVAICNGANREIIGRTVVHSEEPVKRLEEVIVQQESRVRECEKTGRG